MMCPTDGNVLVMSERSGIEIDYCPECRGVWLDRGELDKILEKAASSQEPAPAPPQASPQGGATYQPDPGSYEYDRDQRHQQSQRRYEDPAYQRSGYQKGGYQQSGHQQKRKKHWLEEILG